MKKLFLALPFLAVAIIACKKEDVTEAADNESKNVETRAPGFVNPYEWCGVEHNNVLQHLIDIESSDYADAVDYMSESHDIDPSEFLLYSEIEDDIDMIVDPAEDYLGGLGFSSAVMDVFDGIKDILLTSEEVSTDLDALAETTDASGLFSTEDNRLLLGSIAVAKHSFDFWSNYEGLGWTFLETVIVAYADLQGFAGAAKRGGEINWVNGVAVGGFASREKSFLF